MAEKIKTAKQGDKITEDFCPKCKDKLVVLLDNGESEVYECKNCRFKVIKKDQIIEMDNKLKKLIEENILGLATITPEKRPYIIAVQYVKVKDGKLVITDNYMKTTPMNIKLNPNVCLAFWDSKNEGYRIEGLAEYWIDGEYLQFVKSLKENKNEPCKGAITVTISKIQKLG